MEKKGEWDNFKQCWSEASPRPPTSESGVAKIHPTPEVWSTWSKRFVHDISHFSQVEEVLAIGSVLAISLRDLEGAGKFHVFPVL
jgi:dethiobiotin synthetase/adenosylmethionine--8-amino-7-oxononanoate aminotransferase